MRKKSILILSTTVAIFLAQCTKKEVTNNTAKDETTSQETNTNSILASPAGDVVGKVTVGYQGWFAAVGDGSPYNSWQHQNLEMWPDCSEFINTYAGDPFQQGGVVQAP